MSAKPCGRRTNFRQSRPNAGVDASHQDFLERGTPSRLYALARAEAGTGRTGPQSLPSRRRTGEFEVITSELHQAEKASRARALLMAIMAVVLIVQATMGFGDEASSMRPWLRHAMW